MAIKFKEKLEDYTEEEFLPIIKLIFEGNFDTEEECHSIVDHIKKISEHPRGSGIIFYPETGSEDSPTGVLKTIKDWRAKNGKPGFKKL